MAKILVQFQFCFVYFCFPSLTLVDKRTVTNTITWGPKNTCINFPSSSPNPCLIGVRQLDKEIKWSHGQSRLVMIVYIQEPCLIWDPGNYTVGREKGRSPMSRSKPSWKQWGYLNITKEKTRKEVEAQTASERISSFLLSPFLTNWIDPSTFAEFCPGSLFLDGLCCQASCQGQEWGELGIYLKHGLDVDLSGSKGENSWQRGRWTLGRFRSR